MKERPIFYDSTGRRWRIAKLCMLALIILGVMGGILYVYGIMHSPILHRNTLDDPEIRRNFGVDVRTPSEIAYSINSDVPILGEGILVRFVSIHSHEGERVATDVYTGRATRVLTDNEVAQVGNSRYAIEKYGATTGNRVILTFDDGPHPTYTPQILDLLAREGIKATFFPTGANVVQYPDLTRRIVAEGHDIANHTFSHADLDHVNGIQAEQEINQTQRVLRSVAGVDTRLFRIPYGGNDDASLRDDKRAILEAQKLGYSVTSYTFDSVDWNFTENTEFTFPEFKGGDTVVLLHDAGGNRSRTVVYAEELIKRAKASGYTFANFSQLYKGHELAQRTPGTAADTASLLTAQAILVWSRELVHILFLVSVAFIFLTVVFGIILAELHLVLFKPRRRHNHYNPLVSVIIPAYNEEKVLEKTVSSVLASYYRNLEVIIIDDGSSDGTWHIMQRLQRRSSKIRIVHQRNAGKSVAVNKGIAISKGEVLVALDADTVFTPVTIGKMARYFYYEDVGAVAGVVKVGNLTNWITRWQALEYVTSINIDRAAQAFLNAITVAPGACSAWRKQAVLRAGGYSDATLAEDCDLTLAVRKLGYTVVQDRGATGFTESPETLRGLAKQRFRWLYGSIQAMWKHRDVMFRPKYRWLGMYVLPKTAISIAMQLIFGPFLVFVVIGNMLAGNGSILLLYAAVSFGILVFTAFTALVFAHERFRFLASTPAFRLVYGPMRSFLLYSSILAALGGLQIGWNKVDRSGSVGLRERHAR